MTDKELMQQALEALENAEDQLPKPYSTDARAAIAALRERLAQPEQEPVAWMDKEVGAAYLASELDANDDCAGLEPLYTTPPRRARGQA